MTHQPTELTVHYSQGVVRAKLSLPDTSDQLFDAAISQLALMVHARLIPSINTLEPKGPDFLEETAVPEVTKTHDTPIGEIHLTVSVASNVPGSFSAINAALDEALKDSSRLVDIVTAQPHDCSTHGHGIPEGFTGLLDAIGGLPGLILITDGEPSDNLIANPYDLLRSLGSLDSRGPSFADNTASFSIPSTLLEDGAYHA